MVHGLDRLRCASLLKPLYCWAAAAHVPDQGFWRRHAEPAVITSSQQRHTGAVDGGRAAGDPGPSSAVAAASAGAPPNGDPSRFGSVEVAAAEVADAYAALSQSALAGDPVASDVLSWMRRGAGRPGLRRCADVLRVPEAAIKCGWYGGADESWLRTHAVRGHPARRRRGHRRRGHDPRSSTPTNGNARSTTRGWPKACRWRPSTNGSEDHCCAA
ncbi:hypothetical protein [Nonomuraea dietziae]|uniref:hypothetical protein n=1 Tax=Nonomuraea dietziae TaxID=65515 RepID=UPI0031E1381B